MQSKWSDANLTEDPMYMIFTDFQAEHYKKPSVVKIAGECKDNHFGGKKNKLCLISKAQYQGNDHA